MTLVQVVLDLQVISELKALNLPPMPKFAFYSNKSSSLSFQHVLLMHLMAANILCMLPK